MTSWETAWHNKPLNELFMRKCCDVNLAQISNYVWAIFPGYIVEQQYEAYTYFVSLISQLIYVLGITGI